jgi:hypothetical protein
MCAHYCLLTSLEIDSGNFQHNGHESYGTSVPLHLPVHPSRESFIIVGSEAYIEYWRSVFILLDQLAARFLVLCIIQVDMLIPRRNQQQCRRFRREFEGRYRVGWWLRKLELDCYPWLALLLIP